MIIMFKEIKLSAGAKSRQKTVFNNGINDADYLVHPVIDGARSMCPYYKVWKEVIRRCFDPKWIIKRPTYKDCTISNDWLVFSNFKKWMKTQDWKDKCLDKDILTPGNKHYSAKNCVFIPYSINNLMLDSKKIRGDYPQGVTYDKSISKFDVKCNINGKQKRIDRFKSVNDASKAYIDFKSNLIRNIAIRQKDERVKKGLFKHIKALKNEYT